MLDPSHGCEAYFRSHPSPNWCSSTRSSLGGEIPSSWLLRVHGDNSLACFSPMNRVPVPHKQPQPRRPRLPHWALRNLDFKEQRGCIHHDCARLFTFIYARRRAFPWDHGKAIIHQGNGRSSIGHFCSCQPMIDPGLLPIFFHSCIKIWYFLLLQVCWK